MSVELYVCVPLLERLVDNVTTAGRSDNIREASLEALGYICQDIVSAFHPCVVVVSLFFVLFCSKIFVTQKRKFSSLGLRCTRSAK